MRSTRWTPLALASTLSLFTLACGDDDGGGDAGPSGDSGPTCASHADCDDGVFCNGEELCQPGVDGANALGCLAGASPCLEGQTCDEGAASCRTECGMDPDADGDGVDSIECGGEDCDDTDAEVFPGAAEVCDLDGRDEDCDPTTNGGRDLDQDLEVDARCCNGDNCGVDCNDSVSGINTDTSEVCDGFDNDCDGAVDEGVTVPGFADMDRDGVGDGDAPMMACAGSRGFAVEGGDCDDTRADVRPWWFELCDGVDNDCNELVDDAAAPVAWYPDADGDGFGVALEGETVVSCAPVEGYAPVAGDCDDTDPMVSPGALERCNGRDDDCDGVANFFLGSGDSEDDDRDGVPDEACGMEPADCDDLDAQSSGADGELCDGRDNDCDGTVDEDTSPVAWYADADGDGWGDEGDIAMGCELFEGRTRRAGDCDDADASVHPGVLDGCLGTPGEDDDCDDAIDETTDALPVYLDTDGDGWGSGAPVFACAPPDGYAADAGDCAPDDDTRFPSADEMCDAGDEVDNDCDGLVDCDDPDCESSASCDISVRLSFTSTGPYVRRVNEPDPTPITVRVEDLAGTALPGREVTLYTDSGVAALPTVATSDGSGVARFAVRGDAVVGTATLRFAADGARSIFATIETGPLDDGELFTLVNVDMASPAGTALEDMNVPGPAAHVRVYSVRGIARANDGTVYFSDVFRVFRILPNGRVELLAGNGDRGALGDFGMAVDAQLDLPGSLALDEDRGRLYIGQADRVRVVYLASGTIETYAGGGAVGAPTYGDGGPATNAQFDRANALYQGLALASDGTLYLCSHGYVRAIDPDTRIIQSVLEVGGGPSDFRMDSCGPIATDPDARLVVAGRFRGDRVGTSTSAVWAVGRIEMDGTLTEIAGEASGFTMDGGLATESRVGQLDGIVVDNDGNVFLATDTRRIRRIDAASGLISTVAGGETRGASGDYGPAVDGLLDFPGGLAFTEDGTLLIAASGNRALRGVWGASP